VYSTILLDMETHRPTDVLADREAGVFVARAGSVDAE
jgi:hypothetical protein